MSTATLPAPPSIDVLACGCPTHAHNPGCGLDTAEQIASLAVEMARVHGGLYRTARLPGDHPLIAALVALDAAGLLRNFDDIDPMDYLLGLLDDLWVDNLINRPQSTIVGGAESPVSLSNASCGRNSDLGQTPEEEHAEAASGVSDR